MACAGSMPCQNKWLGSKFVPMASPHSARSLSIVLGLYTTKPGCISIATLTPWSFRNAFASRQYGMTFSSHCHLMMSENSVGQEQVTQFGDLSLGEPPGQPLKLLTT